MAREVVAMKVILSCVSCCARRAPLWRLRAATCAADPATPKLHFAHAADMGNGPRHRGGTHCQRRGMRR